MMNPHTQKFNLKYIQQHGSSTVTVCLSYCTCVDTRSLGEVQLCDHCMVGLNIGKKGQRIVVLSIKSLSGAAEEVCLFLTSLLITL